MTNNHQEASRLHKYAATYYVDAAKNHTKAAECYDKTEASAAKDHSKNVMICCDNAHKTSNSACGCSDKT